MGKMKKLGGTGEVYPYGDINLDLPAFPACLNLHNVDVIVRVRTLKDIIKN